MLRHYIWVIKPFLNSDKYTRYILTHSNNVDALGDKFIIEKKETVALLYFLKKEFLINEDNIIELNQLLNILQYFKKLRKERLLQYHDLNRIREQLKLDKGDKQEEFRQADQDFQAARIHYDDTLDMVNQLEDFILNDYIPHNLSELNTVLLQFFGEIPDFNGNPAEFLT